MSKAKWFVVRKPSAGEIIATSANQIVPRKFHGRAKMLYYIHQIPLSYCSVEGGSGDKTTTPQDAHKRLVLQVYLGLNTLEFSAIHIKNGC